MDVQGAKLGATEDSYGSGACDQTYANTVAPRPSVKTTKFDMLVAPLVSSENLQSHKNRLMKTIVQFDLVVAPPDAIDN